MNRLSGIFLIIIILIVYPVNGFMGDHRYDTCQDYDTSNVNYCLLYTSPSPRDATLSRMPSSA